MGELDTKLGSPIAAAMSDDTGEAGLAVIGIQSEATVADAATPLDARRFDDEQSRARIGQHAEVIEVPVGGHAVVGAVLAHGRNDDAVRELEIGEPNGRKQCAGHVMSIG